MQKANAKKTKLVPKKSRKRALILSILIGTILLIGMGTVFLLAKKTQNLEKSASDCSGLYLQNECFDLEIADTQELRAKGLSGRESLDANQGMLFVFDNVQKQCFWMKDMNFPLDIIWTDSDKKIIKIEKNLSPKTYPQEYCAENTGFVLEFNSGFADKHGLNSGTTLKF